MSILSKFCAIWIVGEFSTKKKSSNTILRKWALGLNKNGFVPKQVRVGKSNFDNSISILPKKVLLTKLEGKSDQQIIFDKTHRVFRQNDKTR